MQTINRRQLTLSALALAGLGASTGAFAEAPKKVVLLINGNLGDQSFFDSAAAGIHAIQQKYGPSLQARIIEMGVDQSKWKPTLQDVSEQDYDLVYLCTFEVADILADVAPDYPKQTYVLMDGTVPYAQGGYDKVCSIVYKQNEGSYLAGVLAAGLLTDGAIPASLGGNLGFLGGIDIPVINDFLIGYVEGAKAVDPAIKIAISYAGSFNDAAKGKELALAQYRTGTAIGFNVAGLTGLGQLAAAKETEKYAIGVNSDQEAIFAKSDPAMAARVVTSVLKRLDVSVQKTYEQFLAGTLPTGKVQALGLADGAVGIVEGGVMAHLAPAALKARVTEAREAIVSGKITVSTAFGKDAATIEALRASVRP